MDGSLESHPSAGAAFAGRGRRAVLGPGAGGVRRDDHLRRKFSGADADHAAGRLPGIGEQPRRGHRPQPRAARGFAGGAHRTARSLAGGVVTLEARIQAGVGAFELDVQLAVAAGELVAVLGPNGAGKTSLLRALAGLLPLSAGHVTLD